MILKFNESRTFLIGKDIVNNLEDICTNLKDDLIDYNLEPNNDIKIKFLGIYLEGGIKRTKFELEVKKVDKLKDSQIDSLLSTFKYIENYITSEEITFNYELYFVKNFPKRVGSVGSVTNLVESKFINKELLTISGKETNKCKTIIIKFIRK